MRLFILLGLIGLSLISTVNAACTNQKLLPALTKLSLGVNLVGEEVEVKMPLIVSKIVSKCILEKSEDLSFLETQKLKLMKTYKLLTGPSGAMVKYCTTLTGSDEIRACFDAQEKASKELNILVFKSQKLYWDRKEKVEKKEKALKKASKKRASQKIIKINEKQIEETRKVLDALKKLNDIN